MSGTGLDQRDRSWLDLAVDQARQGAAEGGVPVGAAIIANGRLLAVGRNRRIQEGSVIRHAEMDALENAGRLPLSAYRAATMYTTLSPCDMCTGAVLHYRIPRVVIGDHEIFIGGEDLLRARGVEVIVVGDPEGRALMQAFVTAHEQLWNEDIGGNA